MSNHKKLFSIIHSSTVRAYSFIYPNNKSKINIETLKSTCLDIRRLFLCCAKLLHGDFCGSKTQKAIIEPLL